VKEPKPPDPPSRRYSRDEFPPYRFVPGLNPHPRSDPRGHAYGRPDVRPPPWVPGAWRSLEPYLFGVDLFNYAFWWECHETLEGLWHAAGRTSVPAQFLQGIILVAAANLNRHLGKLETARGQAEDGLSRFGGALAEGPAFMGLSIPRFREEVRRSFAFDGASAPRVVIELGIDDAPVAG
jgi:hypothetical protein